MTDGTDLAFVRAVDWIRRELGSVHDLSQPVIQVIWVTVYRSMETGLEAEAKGQNHMVLLKDTLQGGDLMMRFGSSVNRLEFIRKMIPAIRRNQSERGKQADSQLLIDLLKWDMLDAADMSLWQRFRARRSAKADPMYQQLVPSAIL
jgi:hypothetical protein